MNDVSVAASPLPRCKFGPLGRIKPDRRLLATAPRLADFLTGDPVVATVGIDYRGGVKTWGMLGNDRVGNCAEAAALHIAMAQSAVVTGSPLAFTDADAIELYAMVTGYNPATGAGDNGTDLRTLLNFLMTTGYKGVKLLGYCIVDHTNDDEVDAAEKLFGPLLRGIDLPKSAEAQTDSGQVWDLVPWSPILGGHAVASVAKGSGGSTEITWGDEQPATSRFDLAETEELYAPISPLWLNAKGFSPTGANVDALIAAAQQYNAAA